MKLKSYIFYFCWIHWISVQWTTNVIRCGDTRARNVSLELVINTGDMACRVVIHFVTAETISLQRTAISQIELAKSQIVICVPYLPSTNCWTPFLGLLIYSCNLILSILPTGVKGQLLQIYVKRAFKKAGKNMPYFMLCISYLIVLTCSNHDILKTDMALCGQSSFFFLYPIVYGNTKCLLCVTMSVFWTC